MPCFSDHAGPRSSGPRCTSLQGLAQYGKGSATTSKPPFLVSATRLLRNASLSCTLPQFLKSQRPSNFSKNNRCMEDFSESVGKLKGAQELLARGGSRFSTIAGPYILISVFYCHVYYSYAKAQQSHTRDTTYRSKTLSALQKFSKISFLVPLTRQRRYSEYF